MTRGERIRNRRLEMNYTLEKLANLMNISKSNLQRYEKDEINIPMDKIEKLSKYLNVSPAYFFEQAFIDDSKINYCSIDDVSDEEFYLVEHKGKMIKFYIKELSPEERIELTNNKKGALAFNDKVSEEDMNLLENILSEMYLKNKLGK
ncbi:helix-turn-helix domain-containing protein [Streptobacillus canis]|uniref:helix-turn-helix domain-containing protein n=1 Tax=Streptobacillus canis TaxID=2678686 RepID=UPI0012E19D0F|nr:helix-turn-helix transcriptional regulator [Streptobacillus canis]